MTTTNKNPSQKKTILIIGISAAGADSLPAKLLQRIAAADLLVGGRRHLAYFPDFKGETFPIGADIEAVARRLQQAQNEGRQAVVLASGDPLCYGIGASLRRYFSADELEIIPAASAFQLAFAALAEPWNDAALLSAHARPLVDVVARMLTAPKAAILTDNQHTPAAIADALLKAGLLPESACAICENLGGAQQRIVHTTLVHVGDEEYAPLNVFVVWNDSGQPSAVSRVPGLPDEAFSTSARQITKREVRLLSLAELALGLDEVLWDIGAGSGAVGIEAALAQPSAQVYAIEKRPQMCAHIRENLTQFPAPNYQLTEGVAPDNIGEWPSPNAVFIGGSGSQLEAIIKLAQQQLQPEGRLVINLATLDNLQLVRQLLPDVQITQVQINRGVPILEMVRFEALNPVFVVTWKKT